MTFDLRSYDGVGSLRFGASKEEIHKALGSPSSSFLKANATPTDMYSELGLFVYYDSENRSKAYEMFPPAKPMFQNTEILGKSFSEIDAWFRGMDPQLKTDGAGFTSLLFGVGVYAPSALKEPQEAIEGVIVFKEGYYD